MCAAEPLIPRGLLLIYISFSFQLRRFAFSSWSHFFALSFSFPICMKPRWRPAEGQGALLTPLPSFLLLLLPASSFLSNPHARFFSSSPLLFPSQSSRFINALLSFANLAPSKMAAITPDLLTQVLRSAAAVCIALPSMSSLLFLLFFVIPSSSLCPFLRKVFSVSFISSLVLDQLPS